MGRPKVSDGLPISIRLDVVVKERLEAMRTRLAPGVDLTLTQVVRAALVAGLDALNAPPASGSTPTKAAPTSSSTPAPKRAKAERKAKAAPAPELGDLPARMAAWREAKSLSMKGAAVLAKVSLDTWWRVENGGTARPATLDAIRRTVEG